MGIPLCWRRGEGLATSSTQILAGRVHSCSAQELIPTSGFVRLPDQVEDVCAPTRHIGPSARSESSSEEFRQPESPACPRPGEVLSHSPTCCGECLPGPIFLSWKLCSLALKPRGGWQKGSPPEQSQSLQGAFPALYRQGDYSQPKLRAAPGPSQLESLCGTLRIAWSGPPPLPTR